MSNVDAVYDPEQVDPLTALTAQNLTARYRNMLRVELVALAGKGCLSDAVGKATQRIRTFMQTHGFDGCADTSNITVVTKPTEQELTQTYRDMVFRFTQENPEDPPQAMARSYRTMTAILETLGLQGIVDNQRVTVHLASPSQVETKQASSTAVAMQADAERASDLRASILRATFDKEEDAPKPFVGDDERTAQRNEETLTEEWRHLCNKKLREGIPGPEAIRPATSTTAQRMKGGLVWFIDEASRMVRIATPYTPHSLKDMPVPESPVNEDGAMPGPAGGKSTITEPQTVFEFKLQLPEGDWDICCVQRGAECAYFTTRKFVTRAALVGVPLDIATDTGTVVATPTGLNYVYGEPNRGDVVRLLVSNWDHLRRLRDNVIEREGAKLATVYTTL